MRRLTHWLRSVLRRGRLESDMADEMAFHLAARAEALEREGLPREEALRRARLEFGAPDRYKEECRSRSGCACSTSSAPTCASPRGSWRARAFSLATIAILAVAIGAGTALFSTADAVLLRLLPVERPRSCGGWPGSTPSAPASATRTTAACARGRRPACNLLRVPGLRAPARPHDELQRARHLQRLEL